MIEYLPYRLTIRNVDPAMADLLRDIALKKCITLGDAFDDAVLAFQEQLTATDDREKLIARYSK